MSVSCLYVLLKKKSLETALNKCLANNIRNTSILEFVTVTKACLLALSVSILTQTDARNFATCAWNTIHHFQNYNSIGIWRAFYDKTRQKVTMLLIHATHIYNCAKLRISHFFYLKQRSWIRKSKEKQKTISNNFFTTVMYKIQF